MIRQMTLRKIPDEIEEGLRAKAEKTGSSLNQTAIMLLEKALGIREADAPKRDLSRFLGQWSREECEAFEQNTHLFEQIEDEVWQS